jgi:hypothetical protein
MEKTGITVRPWEVPFPRDLTRDEEPRRASRDWGRSEFNAAVDVTAGLLRLNGNLVDQSARLVDRCGPAVSAAARSSFTIGGRHATPIQPGGPVPDFLFEPGGAASDRGTP